MLFNIGTASFAALVTTWFCSYVWTPTLRREGLGQTLHLWRLGAFSLCFIMALAMMLYIRS